MLSRFRCAAAAVVGAALLATPVSAGGPGCEADLDGSGLVDFPDLLTLLASWGPCPGCPADLDGNDAVDFVDLLSMLAAWDTVCTGGKFVATDIVGESLGEYPFFHYVRAFNTNDTREIALDPGQHPAILGRTVDAYVTEAKTAAEWDGDPSLTDVRGAAQSVTFSGVAIQDTATVLIGGLDAEAGTAFGHPYDLVLDVDGSGTLSGGDYIDGYGDEAGFYVVFKPTSAGPLPVSQLLYTGGTFLAQKTYYPTDIATMGELPVFVISHGNGHQYTWYDYLGTHLASYGFIVMSHQNNTGPGIETASTTTLTNTDYLLGNLGSIGGGVLNGHVDTHTIIWSGHSRGGEGVVRAYDRLFEGGFSPSNYTIDDIVLVSSISPTDFGGIGAAIAQPHGVDYHLIYGSSDGDVSGAPSLACCQPFRIYERAEQWKAEHYVQGADHNDFNCCGFNDFQGPAGTQIGRPEAQAVAKSAYLALVQNRIRGSVAGKDFLTRQYEDLRPGGVDTETIVDLEYNDGPAGGNFIVDNFQTQASLSVSSSGGAVSGTVTNRLENRMRDGNTSLSWIASDPWNGMTRALASDVTRGTVFDWNADSFLEFAIIAAQRDLSDDKHVSFRACQGTRHPNTVSELGDLTFTVTLRDGTSNTSSINIGAYGGGVEEPYQRTGGGTGAGWANEFEIIRIRLTDFLNNGSGVDLTDIVAIRFEFGSTYGSAKGRIGLDDVEITHD